MLKQPELASQILIIDQSDQKEDELAAGAQNGQYETIERERQRDSLLKPAEGRNWDTKSTQLRSFEIGSYRFDPISYANLHRKQKAYEILSGSDRHEEPGK